MRTWSDDSHSKEKMAENYAAELVQDCYSDALDGLPDLIKYHIDYEGIGRDMLLSGDITYFRHNGELSLIINPQDF